MFKTLRDAAQLAKDLADAGRNYVGGKAGHAAQRAEDALGIERVRMQFMCGSLRKPYVVVLRRKRGEKFVVTGYEIDVRLASAPAQSGTASPESETRPYDEFDWKDWACPCCHWHGAVGMMTFISCACGSSQCGSTAIHETGGTKITCDFCNWTGYTRPPSGSLLVLKQNPTALPTPPRQVLLPKR